MFYILYIKRKAQILEEFSEDLLKDYSFSFLFLKLQNSFLFMRDSGVVIGQYTLKNKGASRCHRRRFVSKWFHKEPLTSFCFTKGSLRQKKVL